MTGAVESEQAAVPADASRTSIIHSGTDGDLMIEERVGIMIAPVVFRVWSWLVPVHRAACRTITIEGPDGCRRGRHAAEPAFP